MSQPTIAILVKFKSQLSLDEIRATIAKRIESFRALKGLQQKYYMHEPATGEVAGFYLWESPDDFLAFRDSELRQTIAEAYQTVGQPRIEIFNIETILRN